MSDEMLVRTTNYPERSGRGENKDKPFMDCRIRPIEVCFALHGPGIAECRIEAKDIKLEILEFLFPDPCLLVGRRILQSAMTGDYFISTGANFGTRLRSPSKSEILIK
jgi:hypothetical protein